MGIQDAGCFDAGDRLAQARDRFSVAALAEVWYTLNKIADWRLPIDDWLIRAPAPLQNAPTSFFGELLQ